MLRLHSWIRISRRHSLKSTLFFSNAQKLCQLMFCLRQICCFERWTNWIPFLKCSMPQCVASVFIQEVLIISFSVICIKQVVVHTFITIMSSVVYFFSQKLLINHSPDYNPKTVFYLNKTIHFCLKHYFFSFFNNKI